MWPKISTAHPLFSRSTWHKRSRMLSVITRMSLICHVISIVHFSASSLPNLLHGLSLHASCFLISAPTSLRWNPGVFMHLKQQSEGREGNRDEQRTGEHIWMLLTFFVTSGACFSYERRNFCVKTFRTDLDNWNVTHVFYNWSEMILCVIKNTLLFFSRMFKHNYFIR